MRSRTAAGSLAGAGTMARLIARRDRLRLLIWLAAIVAVVGGGTAGVVGLYSDAELAAYAETIDGNTAIIAFTGPTYDIGTRGGRVAFEISSQLFVAVGLLAALSMTRHNRAEEESGRAELLRSLPLGRHATLVASFAVATVASAAIGLGAAGSLLASGLSFTGSLTLAAGVAAVGACFAGVGAVTAQLTETGRAASGLALAVLGVAFALRAVGDTTTPALRWLSPIGIAQHARAFAGERWWPLLLLLVLAGALLATAIRIGEHRDFGAGIVADRPGAPRAPAWLTHPIGLAFRLQRGVLLAWTIGLAAFAAMMGSVAESAEDLVGDDEAMQDFLRASGLVDIVDSFLATIVLMVALLAGGYALQSALRLRTEEQEGRAELLLSTGITRLGWLGSNLVVTAAGTVVVLAAGGAAMGLTHGIVAGDLGQVPRLAIAAVAYAPAVLVLVGVAVLLHGVSARATPAAWAVLAVAVVVGIFADLLRLPSWLRGVSPYDHVALVPALPVDGVALALVAAAGALAAGAGAVLYLRRDAA